MADKTRKIRVRRPGREKTGKRFTRIGDDRTRSAKRDRSELKARLARVGKGLVAQGLAAAGLGAVDKALGISENIGEGSAPSSITTQKPVIGPEPSVRHGRGGKHQVDEKEANEKVAGKRTWTLEALIKSSGKLRRWRASPANYANSTRRILERTIPYKGTNSILFQFHHWGMTQNEVIHNTHLMFTGMLILSGAEAEAVKADGDTRFMPVMWEGVEYMCEKPTMRAPIRVRCSCADSYYRGTIWNFKEGAAFGGRPRPYKRKTPPPPAGRPYANPGHYPMVCKHIINSFGLLERSGLTRPGWAAQLKTMAPGLPGRESVPGQERRAGSDRRMNPALQRKTEAMRASGYGTTLKGRLMNPALARKRAAR